MQCLNRQLVIAKHLRGKSTKRRTICLSATIQRDLIHNVHEDRDLILSYSLLHESLEMCHPTE